MFIVGANLSPVCTWMTLPIKGQHVGTMKTGPLYIVFLRDSDCKSQATLCFYAVFAANSQPSEKIKTIASGVILQRGHCADLESEGPDSSADPVAL